ISAQNALVAAFGSTLVASIVLAVALVRHDFALTYVADHTSRALPTVYALSAFWGGQEGSLLLWLLVLTGYGVLAVLLNRKRARPLGGGAARVLGGVPPFFSFLLAPVARRFEPSPPPVDGGGRTPTLQTPYMVPPPPLLYLGYVGLTVPFAF